MITRSDNQLSLSGDVTISTVNAIYRQGLFPQKEGKLPAELVVDFAALGKVDSSAVSLMLVWIREAQQKGVKMRFVYVPDNLQSLAELYGVADLISCN